MKKRTGWLWIGITAVALTACGSQEGNGHAASPAASASASASGQASDGAREMGAHQASYVSLYRTSVFLGDSITEGLSYHDVLEEEQVLAGAGKTAEFALENVEELVRRKPERVFIQLGSDDLLWPTDDPLRYSLTHYAQLIERIREKMPQTKLTLLSVTPVTAEVEKAEPRYANIGDYNEGLASLAAKAQVEYADLTALVHEHAGLYDADGIHFQAGFYPILLDYLKDRLN